MSHVDRNDLHVIVVGGGLGWLAATLVLARRGHRVTLVERDADTPRGGRRRRATSVAGGPGLSHGDTAAMPTAWLS